MSLLDRLERKFGRFYIPNLTVVLVFGQAVFFVLWLMQAINIYDAVLIPALVLQGEVWRLLTFPFVPALQNPIFFAFALYLFYMMGMALERAWGEFRYNVYLAIGYLAIVAVSFLTPMQPAGIGMLGTSVFLAFAFLNPDFELLLFFILPVRIKWLALLTWVGYFWGFATGDMGLRLRILAAIGNFLIFFWPELLWRVRRGGRRMAWQTKAASADETVLHRCAACGITNVSHPEMLFRYCSQCEGNPAYCSEHFKDHAHIPKSIDDGSSQ